VLTVNVAWTLGTAPVSEAGFLLTASNAAYGVLHETDGQRQRSMIVEHIRDFLDASVVRGYDLGPDDGAVEARGAGGAEPPALALEMERELLRRALAREQSLISNHPRLDPELSQLAQRCRAEQIVTHVVLARAHGRTQGVFAIHWIGCGLPPYERRAGFYSYLSSVALAIAATRERASAERELAALNARLLLDPLTDLPNGTALEQRLHEHADTTPMSVVAVDFDGMRDANNTFNSYELGGDVLIRAIGAALPAITSGAEFVARLHRAGDEFGVLLPHADEAAAIRRAREIEAALDALEVPASHRSVYHGASAAAATRRDGETLDEVLARAIAAMHRRKAERRVARQAG
jgi:diguanylate cyclase (GGDEF)-like protein